MAETMKQEQVLWKEQWSHFTPTVEVEKQQLRRWLKPLELEEVQGLDVLDAGCGNGIHSAIYALAGAKSVHGADYASWAEAETRFGSMPNVRFSRLDLSAEKPSGTYDLVVCIGVLPHVDDPRQGVLNMASALRPSGRLVIWSTVREGNDGLWLFDRAKVVVTKFGGRRAKTLTATLIANAIRPGRFLASHSETARELLPYGHYMAQLGNLPQSRVVQNFYDALNAPRRILYREAEVTEWMASAGLDVEVSVCDDGKSRTWVGVRR